MDPDGYRRWIVSGYYFDLFSSWDGIRTIPDLHCMRAGADLMTAFGTEVMGSFLVKGHLTAHVYITDGPYRRWITSEETRKKYQFNAPIQVWDQNVLMHGYLPGPDWT
ncbi:hypothetical protein [Actinophytocola sp.]|uniref:hypothetical protein n=1 Tax=Actinophytocola sp. TaxID=1872138 RepID=UPI002DBFEACE|nr:hypothetical protein [Actinophytocola sp.]